MLSKEKYLEEINDYDEATKEHLLYLYDCYSGMKECEAIRSDVEKGIELIFGSEYSKEVMIPLSFTKSYVGQVLFDLLFNKQEKEYTVNELIERLSMVGKYSRQYINVERQRGNLKGIYKHNLWFFKESDVRAYVEKREKRNRK